MLTIGEYTSAGYPIETNNDGVTIHVLALNSAQVCQAVAHFYSVPHAQKACPLCEWDADTKAPEFSYERRRGSKGPRC